MTSGVALATVQGCLIVTLLGDLDDTSVRSIQSDVLKGIQRGNVHGVVFDLSAVPIMDVYDFNRLREMLNMATMLGARGSLAGIAAELAGALVLFGADVTHVHAEATVERAIEWVANRQGKE
jgi:rsbT antagonist protein RsbS